MMTPAQRAKREAMQAELRRGESEIAPHLALMHGGLVEPGCLECAAFLDERERVYFLWYDNHVRELRESPPADAAVDPSADSTASARDVVLKGDPHAER